MHASSKRAGRKELCSGSILFTVILCSPPPPPCTACEGLQATRAREKHSGLGNETIHMSTRALILFFSLSHKLECRYQVQSVVRHQACQSPELGHRTLLIRINGTYKQVPRPLETNLISSCQLGIRSANHDMSTGAVLVSSEQCSLVQIQD